MLERIAEARIREWLSRPIEERRRSTPSLEPGVPLEVQLMADTRALDALAAAAADPEERARLRKEADWLAIRAMVLLESQGRPLAARAFAASRS